MGTAIATTASTTRNHFAPRSNRPPPPRATKVVRFQKPGTCCLSPFTAYAPSPLFIFRRAPGWREQPARPDLNEQNQSDKDENLGQNGPGEGLKQVVDDPHRHAADERSPKISDASKNNHQERIDDVGLPQIRSDVGQLA